jgi:hypothetical protein
MAVYRTCFFRAAVQVLKLSLCRNRNQQQLSFGLLFVWLINVTNASEVG